MYDYQMALNILAIETSCDETACALYNTEQGLLSECVYSQWKTHSLYGGVVPEIASRDHLQRLLRLIDSMPINKYPPTAIAYTSGPGLAGALLTGAATAESLAMAWQCGVIPINHLEGHLLSPLINNPTLKFPYIALLVSGGHTQIYNVHEPNNYQLLGETLDDAAGEAFDKSAILLGLRYPGGKQLEILARNGNPNAIAFSTPNQDKFNFSFSGLKSAVRREINKYSNEDIAASFQQVVAKGLAKQVANALQLTDCKTVCAVGGVAQNKVIGTALQLTAASFNAEFFLPYKKHCSDNAAMIAIAATFKSDSPTGHGFDVHPRWQLSRSI